MNISLRHSPEQQPVEVRLRPVDAARGIFRYELGQEQGELRASLTPAGGVLELNGRVIPFHAARTDGGIQVWMEGRLFRFDFVDRTARRAGGAAAVATRNELTAPMPGTILKVRAIVGARFEAHEPLVIMESMKMEMTLSVPHPGRVGAVLCREGQLVDMGAVLVNLEPDGNEARPA